MGGKTSLFCCIDYKVKTKNQRKVSGFYRQNPKTLIRLQKLRNSKSHHPVNSKLANAQTVRFTGGLFRFEFLTISFVRTLSFGFCHFVGNLTRGLLLWFYLSLGVISFTKCLGSVLSLMLNLLTL